MSSLAIVVPRAWYYYSEFLVKQIVHTHLLESWEQHQNLFGITITLQNVTAISEHYILNILWFKIPTDTSDDPFSEDYAIFHLP
uniref:Uncharacterized protein n=1 Tax=Glyptapanteles flavicoxis TaxID=463051 RepID=B7S8E9_9HYME|nr:conserved hypothetical protein [Glyptapanteles flavicoxis]